MSDHLRRHGLILLLLAPFAWFFVLPVGTLLFEACRHISTTWALERASRQWMLLGKSSALAMLTAILIMGISRFPAQWIRQRDFRGKTLLLLLGLLPLLIPTVIHAASWIFAFGERGIFTRPWPGKSIMDIPHIAVLLVWTAAFLPAGVLVHWLAASREPAAAEEAARMMPLRAHDRLRIQWGLSSLIQLSGTMILTMIILNAAIVPGFFGVDVFAGEIMADFAGGRQAAEVAALSLPVIVICGMLLCWIIRARSLQSLAGGRFRKIRDRDSGARLGTGKKMLIGALVFFSAGLPLLVLCIESRWLTRVPAALALSTDEILNGFINAACTAFCAAIVGGSLGIGSRLLGLRGRPVAWLDILATLPLILPHSLSAAALAQFWAQPGWRAAVYDSILLQPLGLGLIYSPFIYWAMRIGFKTIPSNMTEAAELGGLSTAQRLWNIDLGMSWPWMTAGVGLSAAAALTEIEAAQMLYRPGSQTLPIRIYDLLHYGRNADMAAMCIILLLMAVMTATAWIVWFRAQKVKRVHG
jgi:iron(III) transport system permease protein